MCSVVRLMSFVSFRLPRLRYDYKPYAYNAKCNAHTLCVVQMCSFLLSRTLPKFTSYPAPLIRSSTIPYSPLIHSQKVLLSLFRLRCCIACLFHPIWFCFICIICMVQYIECLYKCDCFCCLFGKLFNITLAFVCIESAYVGWWCGNRVHNEYIQSLHPAYANCRHSLTHLLALSATVVVLVHVKRHENSRSKSSHKWYDMATEVKIICFSPPRLLTT